MPPFVSSSLKQTFVIQYMDLCEIYKIVALIFRVKCLIKVIKVKIISKSCQMLSLSSNDIFSENVGVNLNLP